MGRERRQKIVLAVLLVILGGVLYWRWPASETVPAAPRAIGPQASAGDVGGLATPQAAPDVHLKALENERVKPPEASRDLFRFRPRPVPPQPPPMVVAPPPVMTESGPPPPPPIPLKFIGLVETAAAQRLAVLTDGRGAPLYGKEGDTVLGQYKILRIGAESIEMSYLDGRGRQTIRLSGS
jgi:hypothetical protein